MQLILPAEFIIFVIFDSKFVAKPKQSKPHFETFESLKL